MVLDLREALFDLAEELFEPVNAKIGMKPPLHEQLGAADIDQFLDLGKDLLFRQQIGVNSAMVAVERAEFAF
jgi:hypothetical protein